MMRRSALKKKLERGAPWGHLGLGGLGLLVPVLILVFGLVYARLIFAGYYWILFALTGGGVLVTMSLLKWRWGIYGLLLYLPFAGVPVLAMYPATRVTLLLKDFLFVIPAYIGFFAACIVRKKPISFPEAPIFPLAALAVLVVFHSFNPALPNRLVGLIGLRVWLFYVPLFFLGYHLVDSKEELLRVLRLMIWVAAVPAAIGVIEAILIYRGYADLVYTLYGPAASAVTQGFAQTVFQGGGFLRRIPSTFTFVTQYYAFTMSMAAVGYGLWRVEGVQGRRSVRIGFTFGLIVLAALLSGSRAPFTMIPLLLLLIFVLGPKSRVFFQGWAVVGLMFLVTLYILGTRLVSVLSVSVGLARQYVYSTALGGFQRALNITWMGLGTGIDTGPARYAYADTAQFLAVGGTWYESWYVKTVLELGLPGFVVILLLFFTLIRRSYLNHIRLKDPVLRNVSAALLGFLLWNMLYFLKAQLIDIDPINVYFWLFLGMLMKLPILERKTEFTMVSRE